MMATVTSLRAMPDSFFTVTYICDVSTLMGASAAWLATPCPAHALTKNPTARREKNRMPSSLFPGFAPRRRNWWDLRADCSIISKVSRLVFTCRPRSQHSYNLEKGTDETPYPAGEGYVCRSRRDHAGAAEQHLERFVRRRKARPEKSYFFPSTVTKPSM